MCFSAEKHVAVMYLVIKTYKVCHDEYVLSAEEHFVVMYLVRKAYKV